MCYIDKKAIVKTYIVRNNFELTLFIIFYSSTNPEKASQIKNVFFLIGISLHACEPMIKQNIYIYVCI